MLCSLADSLFLPVVTVFLQGTFGEPLTRLDLAGARHHNNKTNNL